MTNNSAIKIENLEYFYRHQWSGRKIRALNPFSLTVSEGESFGFLGHNGAGKTTTIKLLLGLIRPAAGLIEIFGKNSKETASRRATGYVPEQPYFYDHLTVEEIVSMYAGLSGINSSNKKQAVNSALSRLGILDRRKSQMRSLSKGLVQRVAVAQAICHNPKLLILDEPFSGLDPLGRKELRDIFSDLQKNGTTIFMSSHILTDVESLCGRASIMVKGELKGIFDLQKKDLSKTAHYELTLRSQQNFSADDAATISAKVAGRCLSFNHGSLRLHFDNKSLADAALKISAELGLSLEKFEPVQQSLEDLFVALIKDSDTNR